MKNTIFKILILLLLLFCFTFVSAYSYAQNVLSNISSEVFRLHIIANSDSYEDQHLKYLVRDKLLSYMNTICADVSSKAEAINLAYLHIDDFEKIAQNVIVENGFNYPVNITIEKTNFPTKNYGDISLPAGIYDALNVKIGTASGHNWWCVMFPPLCFVDVSAGIVPDESKEALSSSLEEESYNLISSDDMVFKFKIVEILQNLKLKSTHK